MHSDQCKVFTSALTTTFQEKYGIKLIHSLVYHLQFNSVEKMHSVMKCVLRALCFDCKADWDAWLPATMFALRTVSYEVTEFTLETLWPLPAIEKKKRSTKASPATESAA